MRIRTAPRGAEDSFLQKVQSLETLAVDNGGRALLSVGVAPGLPSFLAAEAMTKVARAERIDMIVEFPLGQTHGRAALDWMLNNLDSEYAVREAGKFRIVPPVSIWIVFEDALSGRRRVALSGHSGPVCVGSGMWR